MLLPYASDRQPTKRPVATLVLLAVNLALTLLLIGLDRVRGPGTSSVLLRQVGIVPARMQWYAFGAYMFFHEGPVHLVVNELYLWVFGAGVEEAVGSLRFLICYVAGGVVAGALQCLVTSIALPPVAGYLPIVGASGACAALVGLFAVRYYRARLRFAAIPFQPHVVYVIAVYLAVQIAGGLYELKTGSTSGMVAYWAHVGGFAFGLCTAYVLRLEEFGNRAYLQQDAARAMERSMPGDAIKRWEALLRREPENPVPRAELARAWLALGDYEQAGLHYEQAISANLKCNRRSEAALLYAEIRDHNVRTAHIRTNQLYLLGAALEELGQFELAADTLRAAMTRSPDAPEAEAALLKVAGIYIRHLRRNEEARILLRLFQERYPRSQFKRMADDLLSGIT